MLVVNIDSLAFIGGTLALEARYGLADKEGGALAALKAHITSTFQAGGFFCALFCTGSMRLW
jgi:hypothetical protein